MQFSNYVHLSSVKSEGFTQNLKSMRDESQNLVQIIAYCIMPTHFHFLITVKPNTKIESEMSLRCSQAFSNLANSYTQSFNKLHKRHGSLFTQNFRRKPVYDNEYLKTVICYIHNNPVRAGIVEKPEEYRYSSAKDYTGEKGLLQIEIIMRQWKTYK